MGNKVEPRRKWIESNVKFSLEDDKSILEEDALTESPSGANQVQKQVQDEKQIETNQVEQVTLEIESGEAE